MQRSSASNIWSDIFAPLVGRILLGGYFLLNGIEAALNFPATVVQLTGAVPEPVSVGVIIITIQVLGGIALVLGIQTRAVALILVLYALATAFIFLNLNTDLALTLFLQRMAIIGGLLYVSSFGESKWTLKLKQYKFLK